MFGIPAQFQPVPPPMRPNEIGAAAAKFHAHGIYGWPMLGGGYKSVSDWAKAERERYEALAGAPNAP